MKSLCNHQNGKLLVDSVSLCNFIVSDSYIKLLSIIIIGTVLIILPHSSLPHNHDKYFQNKPGDHINVQKRHVPSIRSEPAVVRQLLVQVCPDGQPPIMKGAIPLQCSAAVKCIIGYTCTRGQHNIHVCCDVAPKTVTCQRGKPLEKVLCGGSLGCSRGYDCVSNGRAGICCPSVATVCQMKYDAGHALCLGPSPATRYFFDPAKGVCGMFQYSGCGGNANSFNSLEECQSYCYSGLCYQGAPLQQGSSIVSCGAHIDACPSTHMCVEPQFGTFGPRICCPSEYTTCSLDLNIGIPCSVANQVAYASTRFWFNKASKQCTEFQYAGCEGNDNNFKSERECTNFCSKTVCKAGLPYRDSRGLVLSCNAGSKCPGQYACTSDGGSTTFCCPTKKYLCEMPVAVGTECPRGSVPSTRYFYNHASGQCQPFSYAGCGANDNNFGDLGDCIEFCQTPTPSTGACPNGQYPLIASGFSIPQKCIAQSPSSCGPGYLCVQSTTGHAICCTIDNKQSPKSTPKVVNPNVPATPMSPVACEAKCPPGSFTGLQTSTVCFIPGMPNQCPGSLQCVPSTVPGVSICCFIVQPSLAQSPPNCPAGTGPEIVGNSAAIARTCTPNTFGACNSGNICLQGPTGQHYCCAASLSCPGEHEPAMVPRSQTLVMTCSLVVANNCPQDYNCMDSGVVGNGICCKAKSRKARSVDKDSLVERSGVGDFGELYSSDGCPENYVVVDGVCYKKYQPGEFGCEFSEQCSHYPGSLCSEGSCLCPSGLFGFNNTCVLNCPPSTKAKLGKCVSESAR